MKIESTPSDIFAARRLALAGLMRSSRISALLVSNLVNLRYLTGLECSFGFLLCTTGRSWLMTDGRYTAAARAGASGIEVVQLTPSESSAGREISDILKKRRISKLGFEPASLDYAGYGRLKDSLGDSVRLEEVEGLPEQLRSVKDKAEIRLIRKACAVTDAAFSAVTGLIKPGMTERDLRAALEVELISRGIDRIAFDSIVASGPNGAFPHARPSDRIIRAGDFIVLDFGARLDGYHSDMTRTVFIGQPTKEDRRRYNAVNNARAHALRVARPGMTGHEVDTVAREHLEKCGLGSYFTHGLGHGVGLDVHEYPRLSPAAAEQTLESGMVVTIEPGVYIEGWGGIRIEDTCLITDTGAIPLTRSPRTMITL